MNRWQPYTTLDEGGADLVLLALADPTAEEWTLTKVEPEDNGTGWYIQDRSSVIFMPRLPEDMDEPKVGDRVTLYGGFGRENQGFMLNGLLLWYRTPEQRQTRREEQQAAYAADKLRRFEEGKAALDAQYEALSSPLKARIDRFRAADPDFRVESEAYESFCCQQADLLITQFADVDRIKAWADMNSDRHTPPYDYKGQMAAAPKGWDDGHSGNTFGGSVGLAIAVLSGKAV